MKKTNPLTPESFTGIALVEAPESAVGFPALTSTVAQMAKWMSPQDAMKTMFRINQKGGFDCPGCAWPDPDDERSKLGEYCENGIKAIAEEATKKGIGATFFEENSVSELSNWSDYAIGKSGRLLEPMVLEKGATHYKSITWEAAFQRIATHLNGLKNPNEAVFYTSGRTSNEAAFLYQLFIRLYGTNNLPDCSNMCHESSGKALGATLGLGKGSVTLDDFNHAELVLVIGQNPGTNHPRMLSALEKCKDRGGKIIAINPLPEPGLMHFVNPQRLGKFLTGGTAIADLFLQVRINQDVALLKVILILLLEKEKQQGGVVDWAFIKKHTEGIDALVFDLQQQDLQQLIKNTGVAETLIREAADLIASKKRIIICWAMGLTQHKNAVGNIQEIVNLLLLRGSIGKQGAGTCPVRGHSNVQGDRTMGIYEDASAAFLDRLGNAIGFEPPREKGYDTVAAIEAMHEGKVGVFFAMGGNFLSASPDTNYTAEALQRCALTVHVSTKLNRSHLIHGEEALILPCLGRTDIDVQAEGAQFVTCENSMGVVQMSRGVLSPCSPSLKSEVAIVCALAKATIGNHLVNWETMQANYDNIRTLIEKAIAGFDDFNEKVRHPEGFYLPNGPREGIFTTSDAKAHFTLNPAPSWTLEEGEYLMMTIRSHDQFNTTIYGLDDRYRGILNERRVILMNAQDIEKEGLSAKKVVNIFSNYKNIRREARQFIVVPFDIPQGNVATYFPEANTLIPYDEFADKSHTPISKSVVVRLENYYGI